LSTDNESHLVPDRECGECTACCVVLLIDDEDFKKPADQVCSNLMEEWRPDKSGVLLRSDENGIIFQPIREPKEVLTSARAIELIGGGVAQGIPMSMSIPTQKGLRSYGMDLNEPLKTAVESRDLQAIQNKMVKLIDFSVAQETDRITLVESDI
jgi:hypothetical protein